MSAGTGKTVVALHRAAHLAREYPDARLLLTTFNDTLAAALRLKLDLLLGGEPAVRGGITVEAIDVVAMQVYSEAFGEPTLAGSEVIAQTVRDACGDGAEHRLSSAFVQSEWTDVVDEWQLESWEAYRDVPRLGRKKGLREDQRADLWSIFEQVDAELTARGLLTMSRVFAAATRALTEGQVAPFDYAVVDEAQDISVPQLRFLAVAAGGRPDGLFFAGDLGQRIFQTPFSWKSLGVDVRGRSKTLRVNYRTSHEIRRYADRLLPPQLSDVDGNPESRRGTVSVFTGAPPVIALLPSADEEQVTICLWIETLVAAGVQPDEIGVFVRSERELYRAHAAVAAAWMPLNNVLLARGRIGHASVSSEALEHWPPRDIRPCDGRLEAEAIGCADDHLMKPFRCGGSHPDFVYEDSQVHRDVEPAFDRRMGSGTRVDIFERADVDDRSDLSQTVPVDQVDELGKANVTPEDRLPVRTLKNRVVLVSPHVRNDRSAIDRLPATATISPCAKYGTCWVSNDRQAGPGTARQLTAPSG